ncbi:LPS export ABC transporter permease LptG [Sphingorhabdus soli]|uniref:LPS export ABC transporter permease LptG n=1 Tax=Flavisphingopyxis soli TaxID=2601267 RepID=A0A5C6U988_9SPHN|nr:LPS export ABC transporter permease LptG [Sphingorhabdus soli]TXC68078.1 LPS export ABC transporter permease LptG [Sphingorhabdus soli]
MRIEQLHFFPSRTLALYVARMFLTRTLAVLVMLVLILQALDLLGESGKILAVAGNGQEEILRYLGLRVPQIVARFLPFSVLLGTIVTLATLNQNSEVVSMKGGGMSAHQVLAPLLLASLVVAGVAFGFNERVVTRANASLDQWQKVDYGTIPRETNVKFNVWARDGDNLIQVGEVHVHGAQVILRQVRIFERKNHAMVSEVRADRATPSGDGWRIEEARRYDLASGKVTDLGTFYAGKGVGPDRFTMANVDGDEFAFGPLSRAIDQLDAAGRPTTALKAALWHKISGPLSSMLMPLLGAVAAFGLARSGQLVLRAVIGMALGFAYFVADNFGIAMGNLGVYPPIIAAWGPFLLFFLIGEAVLVRTEE